MNFFSPLEQFEIKFFTSINLFDILSIDVTTFSTYFFVIFLIIFFVSTQAVLQSSFLPTVWQYCFELIYFFIINLIKKQTGVTFFNYFPILFTTFIFIITSNLVGLFPFSFTLTSEIVITWMMALSFNISWLLLGFSVHGIKFFKIFVPSGIKSTFLLSIIVCIELVSYLIRTFSLSVRLFANMMAGHTLLHILSTFAVKFSYSQNSFLSVFPFILVIAIVFLEFGIAIIQAYVFIILVIIYLSDVNSVNNH